MEINPMTGTRRDWEEPCIDGGSFDNLPPLSSFAVWNPVLEEISADRARRRQVQDTIGEAPASQSRIESGETFEDPSLDGRSEAPWGTFKLVLEHTSSESSFDDMSSLGSPSSTAAVYAESELSHDSRWDGQMDTAKAPETLYPSRDNDMSPLGPPSLSEVILSDTAQLAAFREEQRCAHEFAQNIRDNSRLRKNNPRLNYHPLGLQRCLQPDVVIIPDEHSAFASFKHRLWFTWYLGQRLDTDSWLYEEEDEEYLKAFAQGVFRTNPKKAVMSESDWVTICLAFGARRPQPIMFMNPLAHLTPQTRLYFNIWLHVVGNYEVRGMHHHLNKLITRWAMWFPLHNDVWAKWFPSRHCHICGVSEFLYIWLETLQAVYSREDLLSIPWDYNCDCLAICLAVMHPKAHIPLGGDSPIVHALYKIVVTPWPLILWMAFRASNGVDVPTFLNTLRDQSCEDIIQLQNWDDEDSSLDVLLVGAESQTRIYPQEWMQYALEIDLRSWMEIRNTTRTTHHRGFHPDIQICIAAACVIFSSPPGTRAFSQTVLNHLRIPNFPFNTITLVIDKDYKPSSNPPLFASKEFWTRPRLESWIATRRLDFCNVVWQTNNLSNLERLEFISQALTAPCLLQRLNIYTCSLMIQLDAARDSFRNITNGFADRIQDNGIPPFGSYASKFEAILAVLKMVAKNHSSNHRAISIDVHKVMSNDICDIMAQLVFILQGAESRKRFLESRNTEAQELLNFLQDLLDLDTFSAVRPLLCKTLIQLSQASGLHPHCFPLTAVQKVGNQVAAGGFADIWKGLVQGQSVSLKIVRIFGDSDIQAALDEFGREALVWRQLCHPNVLPFFGLYYLDERLSLVSPWMERGNVIQFLKNKQTNVNRVSLMLDVALGLQYLHEQNVIHGDLKAINILVTPSGRACICDFGLSSIVNEISLRITRSTSTAQKGTPRYYAPELLGPKGKKHFASDTFAFACVCYEILTEKVPFYEIKNEMVVMLEVLKGIRPTRTAPCMGTAQLDSLWGLLQGCWEEKPKIRPTASQIVEHFVGPSIHAEKTSFTTDWDEKSTSKFRRSSQVRPLLPTATQIEHLLFAEDSAGELHRE